MRCRDKVSLTICPVFLRIALGVTFIWFGLSKFDMTTFKGPQAARLVELGWARSLTPVPVTVPSDTPTVDEDSTEGESAEADTPSDESATIEKFFTNRLKSETDTPPDADLDEPLTMGETPPVEPTEEVEEVEPSADTVEPPVVDDSEPFVAGQVNALGLYKVSLLLDEHFPFPALVTKIGGWVAGGVEVLGGALLLIGLFSRVWGLGLSFTMVLAMYLTTCQTVQSALPDTGGWGKVCPTVQSLDHAAVQTGFFQYALLAMSLFILFGGPGAISIDRLLFGGGKDSPSRPEPITPTE